MKEDSQLICPVSYEDPNDIWSGFEKILLDRLPLRDVTWKSPISSSYITIDSLPLRCLPSTANLFKDTDHAFRWFLAPYVNLYLLRAETLDAYKQAKPNIKKWVDAYNGAKKSPWLVIYMPVGAFTVEVYNKIYSKLCGDFYSDRTGDRSVMLVAPPPTITSDSTNIVYFGIKNGNNTQTLSLLQTSNNSVSDLLSKMREGVVVSFQHRSAMYDSDIRRLDSYRGTAQFDFRTLFLVKESLALMYQMLQLPEQALGQYEELEATLGFAPEGVLLESDWPMVSPESLKPTTESSSLQQPEISPKAKPSKPKDALSDACKNGEDVVAYSINLARMKILQKKMSVLELHRYVFARQMFFLLTHLERPVSCAEKALAFMHNSVKIIERRLDERYLQSIREHESVLNESVAAASATSPDTSRGLEHDAAAEVTANLMNMYKLRHRQALVWVLTASVKIVRVCRDLTCRMVRADEKTSRESPAKDAGSSFSSSASLPSSLNTVAGVFKDSSRVLSELMQFAVDRLMLLAPTVTKLPDKHSVALAAGSGSLLSAASLSTPDSGSQSFRVEFLDVLDRELSIGGFDQEGAGDSLGDTGILIAIALKIKSCSACWAAELAPQPQLNSVDAQSLNALLTAPSNSSGDKQNSSTAAQFGATTPYVLHSERSSGASTVQLEQALTPAEKEMVQAVALAAMVHRAQWELLHSAERLRFAVAIQLRCVNLLMCHGMYHRAVALAETVLRSGLIAPAHLCPTVPDQQQKSRVSRHLGLDSAVKSPASFMPTPEIVAAATANQGDWLELRFWLLRKILYCAEQARDLERYRVVAAHLLLSNFAPLFRGSSLWSAVSSSIARSTLLKNVVFLSTGQSASPGHSHQAHAITSLDTLPELCFPLSSYFKLSVMQSEGGGELSALRMLKGFEVVNDEFHPVSALQCEGGLAGYTVCLQLDSALPATLKLDRLSVVYKRFRANNILLLSGSGSAESVSGNYLSLPSTPIATPIGKQRHRFVGSAQGPDSEGDFEGDFEGGTGSSYLEADEFECLPVDNGQQLKVEPGKQSIPLRFVPPAIGEYRLDRVVLSCGSLVFVGHMLCDCDSSSVVVRTLSLESQQQSLRSHADLQNYFDAHCLIKVAAPENLLGLLAVTPSFSPLEQPDELSLQFRIGAHETVTELSVTARQNHSEIDYSAESGAQDVQPSLTSNVLTSDSQQSFCERRADMTPQRRSNKQQSFPLRDDPALSTNSNNAPVSAVVIIGPSAQWGVTLGETPSSSDENHQCPQASSVLFRSVASGQAVLLSIPFTTRLSRADQVPTFLSSRLAAQTLSTTITVTLSGCLVRRGCRIMFELTANFRVLTGEALEVTLSDLTPVSLSGDGDKRQVFLQAVVRNLTHIPIKLVRYAVDCEKLSLAAEGGGICDSGRDGVAILDGPAEDEEAVLAPGEKYHGGFILETGGAPQRPYLRVQYRRLSHVLPGTDSSTGDTAQQQQLFHKQVPLPLSSAAQVAAAWSCAFALGVSQAAPAHTVDVGTSCPFSYLLELRCRGAVEPVKQQLSQAKTVAAFFGLLGSAVVMSAEMCETASWMVAGPQLVDLSLQPVSAALSDSNGCCTLRLRVEFLLVATTQGDLSLPPMRVHLKLHPAAMSTADNSLVQTALLDETALLYPSPLSGLGAVRVGVPLRAQHSSAQLLLLSGESRGGHELTEVSF